MKNLMVHQLSPDNRELKVDRLSALNSTRYALKLFDPKTIDFLNGLAKRILADKTLTRHQEMVALGFWLRKSQIFKIRQEQAELLDNGKIIASPRGKIFHVCPANVDTMFMYSLAVSLLMGNKNVLRISRRVNNPQILRLFDLINGLCAEEEQLIFKQYINIITYGHDNEVSSFLSLNVNGRLIWGGDSTIKTFQSFEKSPRAKDIVFADRISLMVLDSKSILRCTDKEWKNFVRSFYNDAYTFDQMGCSSPQTIYFIGSKNDCRKAREKILANMSSHLISEYTFDLSSLASLKLNRMVDDALSGHIKSQVGNNLIKLLEIESSSNPASLKGCGAGYFYYLNCNSISDLKTLCVPKVQTISYFGLSESLKADLVALAYGEGIDRIVRLGNALSFHYVWDGYNLFEELCKKVYIEN